jgi:hypothetical protein
MPGYEPSLLRCLTCQKALRRPTVCAHCARPAHADCWDADGCGVCVRERAVESAESMSTVRYGGAR